MDVAFVDGTAYALVGSFVGGDDVVGIYRVDGPTSFTVVADLGAWSSTHSDAVLAPEQTVVVGGDRETAIHASRRFVARYLRLGDYRNNLLREGWAETDLSEGGSDRLIAELVLGGDVDDVARGIRAHLEAGADHVAIQDVGPNPVESFRILAEALL